MATELKVLNVKKRLASTQAVDLFVYAHDNFTPVKSLTITADVSEETSGFIGEMSLTEVDDLPGYYKGSVDSELEATTLGNYFFTIKLSGVEAAFLNISKGPSVEKAEGCAVDNKRIESTFASTEIDYRNLAVGALEKITVSVKNYEDSGFTAPKTEGDVLFSYRSKSPRSDVLISSPVIERPLTTYYFEGFDAFEWAVDDYSDSFEDSSWYDGDFLEFFEDDSWL